MPQGYGTPLQNTRPTPYRLRQDLGYVPAALLKSSGNGATITGGPSAPFISLDFTLQQDMVLSEIVADRSIVSVWDSSGPKVRNGNATDDSKKARGFVNTGGGVGDTVTVFFIGILSGLSGLTIGADYFLSTTPGGITTVAPSTTGNWDQIVGWAITTTDLFFQPLRGLGL